MAAHPKYKLTYLDVRGWAESTRFLFAYVGAPYEDARISYAELPTFKQNTPFKQVPILEIDGEIYGQSVAFNRLLAKKYKLAGTTDAEQAHVDAIYDYGKDIWAANVPWFAEKDEEKKAKLRDEYRKTRLPEQLDVLDSHLKNYGGGKFFAPSGVTFVDFFIASLLHSIDDIIPGALDQHPAIKEYVERVHNLPGIKEWVAIRPKSII